MNLINFHPRLLQPCIIKLLLTTLLQPCNHLIFLSGTNFSALNLCPKDLTGINISDISDFELGLGLGLVSFNRQKLSIPIISILIITFTHIKIHLVAWATP